MKNITIHVSATKNFQHFDAKDIHDWHVNRNKWNGIGYHYVILLNGTVENGRPEFWTGAHVGGHNTGNIGICLIGYDKFTSEQWNALKLLVFKLKLKYPEAEVRGHNDFTDDKTCPNFDAKEWWNGLLESMKTSLV